jgi:hypothetical protein
MGDCQITEFVHVHQLVESAWVTVIRTCEFPVHGTGAVEVAVGAGDEAGRPGLPDEAMDRVKHFVGGERQPAADFDVSAHLSRTAVVGAVPGAMAARG